MTDDTATLDRGSSAHEFAVDVPVFSGPLHILAELVREQRIDVCDLSVGVITDAFLSHASDAASWSLEDATWFLTTCAVLLEMKVARLLPRRAEPDEEDLVGGSPDLAYARSLELAAYRAIAGDLAVRLEREALFLTRDSGPGPEFAQLYPDPLARVRPGDLSRLATTLLRPAPPLDLSHVTPVRYTIAEAMSTLERRLASGERAASTFRELVSDCEDRIHVVVRFLAILELYREGKVELDQARTFGEIEVSWAGRAPS
jgi:segregation and condensation protein A